MSVVINTNTSIKTQTLVYPRPFAPFYPGNIIYLDASKQTSYPTTGSTWYDISGNTNNGTLINSPTFTSANGGAFILDGVNEYVSIPYTSSFATNTLTVDLWFYLSSTGSNYYLVNYGVNSGVAQWYIRNAGNGFNFAAAGTGTPNAVVSDILYSSFPGGFSLNDWYNFTITYTTAGDQGKLYVNGAFFQNIAIVPSGIRPSWSTDPMTFGGYNGAGASYISGSISILQFYNRVLTATEITKNYNGIKGRFGL
jgi:hypothetical protein